jgi:flagellar basal body-associated protein FliL
MEPPRKGDKMSVLLGIFIVTAFVAMLVIVFVLARAASIGSRDEERLARRVTEDEARKRLMGDQFDGTRFYDEKYRGPGGRA